MKKIMQELKLNWSNRGLSIRKRCNMIWDLMVKKYKVKSSKVYSNHNRKQYHNKDFKEMKSNNNKNHKYEITLSKIKQKKYLLNINQNYKDLKLVLQSQSKNNKK